MTLKNLTFATTPNVETDPVLTRRNRLIDRLEEQIELAKNPDYAPKIKRWVKGDDGTKRLVETPKKVSKWWVSDAKGDVYLSVKSGLKRIEFEKGKTSIKVGPPSKLPDVLKTLVEATRAGEMDALIPATASPFKKKIGK